ncbi:MAG: VCBS repeat-containing protein [Solirubrobacterales bacterium]|nr:VCBS repeat-containing protein [Solirubrobacterales bacterium]
MPKTPPFTKQRSAFRLLFADQLRRVPGRTLNTNGVCGVNFGLQLSDLVNSTIRKFVLSGVLVRWPLFRFGIPAQAVSFGAATNFATGTTPVSVATGDLNGDSKPDLAVANYSSDNVSVLLGNGDGTFGAATNFAVGAGPYSVAIGDLNGDSKPDLAVANFGVGNVSVLLGNGDGTFGAATNFTAGTNPYSIAISDLNGDSKPDLAVGNVSSDNVSVLLGNGNGTFGTATNFAAGTTPISIAIGDLNGDSKPDLAVSNVSSDDVSVLLGNGDGTFGAASNITAGNGPFSVAIGDLDGDSKPDLAVANFSSGNISILLGNGDGTFGAATNFTVGAGPYSVAIGDLDGDSKPDLAVANYGSSNASVLLGNGDGTFGAATNFATGANPYSVRILDLNADGKPDLAIANSGSGNVSVLLNTSDDTPPDTFIDSAIPASPANTGVRTFTFHGVDPAPGSPPITYQCRIDGGSWFGCSSGYATPNLADGNHTFDVRATDAAGNTDASPATSSWFVDKTPPNTFIDTATPASPTNNQVRNFTYHGVDPAPGSPPITLECRLDSGAWFTAGCNGTYNTGVLPEGNHTFNVRATDALGNIDPTPASSTWMIDLTDPTINIVSPGIRERFVMGSGSKNRSCADPLHGGPPPVASGVKTCTDNGFSTAHLGNFRFQVDAKDFAGNTATDAHAYAVDPPRYADLVNPQHPIAYYRLGDQLGSDTMADSSGNNRNGEFKNGIALRRPPAPNCHVRPHAPYTCDLTSDPQDWSAFFPARDGYGFTNNITAPQTAYTIEGWIKRTDSGDGSIMGQGGGGQLFVKDGKLALRQTQDTVYASGPTLTPGQWFHVAGTWDGHTTKLYVNGNLVGSSNSANKPPSGSSTLYVGYGDQAPWFHGSLDEMAYYGSALPGSAFATRYEVGTAHDVPLAGSERPTDPAARTQHDLAEQRRALRPRQDAGTRLLLRGPRRQRDGRELHRDG